MTEERKLTLSQFHALRLAREYGVVVIGKGYGRDTFTKNAIASTTFRKLVWSGLLTTRADRQPYTGDVLAVRAGKRGWITEAGEAILHEQRSSA
jgi:hypothetical protein